MSRLVFLVGVVLVVLVVLIVYDFFARPVGGVGSLSDRAIGGLVSGVPSSLSVEVDAVARGGVDVEYTCVGGSRVPSVVVSGLPSGSRAIALIVYDPDAPGGTFIHWLVLAPVEGSGIVLPSPSMVSGLNSVGRLGYFPPCPPKGDKPHRYYFLVVALDYYPDLPAGFTLEQLLDAARGHVIAYGLVVGVFSR